MQGIYVIRQLNRRPLLAASNTTNSRFRKDHKPPSPTPCATPSYMQCILLMQVEPTPFYKPLFHLASASTHAPTHTPQGKSASSSNASLRTAFELLLGRTGREGGSSSSPAMKTNRHRHSVSKRQVPTQPWNTKHIKNRKEEKGGQG